MDIIFKGRRTEVPERFRKHAVAKLGKIQKLDSRAIRVDVEVSQERNPRQSDRRERVELTIQSRGPVIRAEAAADDRYIALDRALAKLEARLRRSCDRRKARHAAQLPGRQAADHATVTAIGPGAAEGVLGPWAERGNGLGTGGQTGAPWATGPPWDTVPGWETSRGWEPGPDWATSSGWDTGTNGAGGGQPSAGDAGGGPHDDVIPIQMEGDGPVVVREKFHAATPMTIDQALLAMELVGHDFYLFRDQECGHPSVVYRRHGYQYGLIRLIEEAAEAAGQRGRRL